jgi:hypothetical protein
MLRFALRRIHFDKELRILGLTSLQNFKIRQLSEVSLTPHNLARPPVRLFTWQAIPKNWHLLPPSSRNIQNCHSVEFLPACTPSRIYESDISKQTHFFSSLQHLKFNCSLKSTRFMSFALTFHIAVQCSNYNIHYPIQIFLFLKGLVRLWSLTVLSDMPDQNFCLASPITQYRQCVYNVTLRRVRVTTVAVGKKQLLRILSVCL